jgi:hypothetical protein
MMDKKKISVFFGTLMALVPGALAASNALNFAGPRDFMERGIDFFTNLFWPILYVLFGGSTWSGEFLFEKLLIFIMLVALIFVILSKSVPIFKDDENKKVKWIIAVIIPLIAIRYIEPQWLNGILLQNAVLAIALTTLLPFIIYFFFLVEGVGKDSHTVRMVGWIIFIVIYFGIWSTSDLEIANYYIWIMVLAIACLVFDGTIQSYFHKQELKKANAASAAEILADLHRRYELMRNSNVPPRQKDLNLKALEKDIRKWNKVIVKNS